jgi:hypothetical protein
MSSGASVSVIVRSRNEVEHLGAVLRAVRAQRWPGTVEIVCLDNQSDDGSRETAAALADQCLDITEYRPGAALNRAVEAARGELLVVLSGHALPADDGWLAHLLRQHGEDGLAGVYGSQRYCDHARFLDKKDLDLFRYGPPRVERVDSDFWNANSSFTRAAWSGEHFDEQVFELEDHYWTKVLLPRGFHVRYEPAAAVYHYGHYGRNDRTLPDCIDDDAILAAAVAVLSRARPSWPERMDAVLRIKTLAHRVRDATVVGRLRVLLREDDDFDVRWRTADALSRFRTPDVAAALADALADRSYYVRDEAAWSLARLGPLGTDAAMRRLPTLPAGLRHLVALALAGSGTAEGTERAAALLVDELRNGADILDALYVAGELTPCRPTAPLVAAAAEHLRAADPAVVRTTCWALGRLAVDDDDGGGLLERVGELALDHPAAEVRGEATTAVTRLLSGPRAAWAEQVVRRAATDAVGAVRFCAVHGARRSVEQGAEVLVRGDRDDADFGVRFETNVLAALAAS